MVATIYILGTEQRDNRTDAFASLGIFLRFKVFIQNAKLISNITVEFIWLSLFNQLEQTLVDLFCIRLEQCSKIVGFRHILLRLVILTCANSKQINHPWQGWLAVEINLAFAVFVFFTNQCCIDDGFEGWIESDFWFCPKLQPAGKAAFCALLERRFA